MRNKFLLKIIKSNSKYYDYQNLIVLNNKKTKNNKIYKYVLRNLFFN